MIYYINHNELVYLRHKMSNFRLDKAEIKTDKIERLSGDRIRFDVTLTRAGIFLYRDSEGNIIRELRSPDQVFSKDSLNTIKGMIFTDDHPPEMVNADNWKQYAVGSFGDTVTVRDNIFIDTSITVYDPVVIDKILSGKKVELSAGYFADTVAASGEWNGQKYDSIQQNIRYNHGSLVDKGRAGSNVKIKFDSNDIDGLFLECEEKTTMAKVKIDNVEFDVSEQLQPVLESKISKLDSVVKELESTKGKMDALEAENSRLKADQEKKDKEDFISKVKSVFPELKIDNDMSVRQIQEAVIKSDEKEAKLDNKSDDYISGIFEFVMKKQPEKKKDSVNPYKDMFQQVGQRIAQGANQKHDLDDVFSILSKGV